MKNECFTIGAYLRDSWVIIFVGFVCSAGMAGMLTILSGVHAALLGAIFSFLCFVFIILWDYLRKKSYYREVSFLLEDLRCPSQIQALVNKPEFLDGRIFFETCERLVRMADAELVKEREQLRLYQEYVELWVHEVKIPVAVQRLVLSDMRGQEAVKLACELERIERQVDTILYYARSASLANDYHIANTSLVTLVGDSLKRNVRFLVEKDVSPKIEVPENLCVLTDETWTAFVLSQVVVNSAKYEASFIRFSAYEEHPGTPHGCTVLEVADDGWGIPASDIPRVFDRGFTGTNGRSRGGSTGMGLYLSALLCRRMGLGIAVASERGMGTRVIISFPHDRSRLNLTGM